MIRVRRIVLDVLKPYVPNCLEFARLLAESGLERVMVTVIEKDDRTETVHVTVEGADIHFESLEATIVNLGASLHSIDEVEVVREAGDGG